MNAISLNYWLCKFALEVAKQVGWKIPLSGRFIFCGLKCFLVEKKGEGKMLIMSVQYFRK